MDEPDFRGETWAIPLPCKVNAHINRSVKKENTHVSPYWLNLWDRRQRGQRIECSGTRRWCSRHDSYGHAITFPSDPIIRCHICRWTELALLLAPSCHVSLSHCQPTFSQFNIMSTWPEGFCQPVYSSKVESTQQNHTQLLSGRGLL